MAMGNIFVNYRAIVPACPYLMQVQHSETTRFLNQRDSETEKSKQSRLLTFVRPVIFFQFVKNFKNGKHF